MTKLLTIKGNPKMDKATKFGFWSAVLHLAPGSISGRNVCPMATAGCLAACLNTAGHGGLAPGGILTHAAIMAGARNTVQAARISRTEWLYRDRAGFLAALAKEIAAHIKRAERAGLTPAFRLNGTSDLRWESMRDAEGLTILERFPDVQFYDYTKIANRKSVPANYALTFSLADGNDEQAARALANGFNVAAVFRSADVRDLYATEGYMGAPVIDGDEHDLRFLDPKGVVVGLYAKGPAKRDRSGFVKDWRNDLIAA